MIEVAGLVKDYGTLRAVDHIDFSVNEGEILGVLGPNGAGKSTTLRVLTGYLSPTAGSVRVGGFDVSAQSREVRRLVGYLPEHNPLYLDMTVYDFLRFCAEVREMPLNRFHTELERTVTYCGLEGVVHRTLGTLSKGYRQRVGLAQAILHDPQLLILDEPTSGLDPNQILEIRRLIRELGRNKTLILSSHILQEVQAVCSRLLIINRGRIAADGSVADLLSRHEGAPRLVLSARIVPAEVAALEQGVPGVHAAAVKTLPDGAMELLLDLPAEKTAEAVYAWVRLRGWVLCEMYRPRVTLEDIFRRITMGEAAEAELTEEGGAE